MHTQLHVLQNLDDKGIHAFGNIMTWLLVKTRMWHQANEAVIVSVFSTI